VLSAFVNFQVEWPTTILKGMIWFRATFNFNFLSLPGVSCLWANISFRSKLITYTLGPLGITLLVAIPVIFSYFRRPGQTKADKEDETPANENEKEKRYQTTLDRFWSSITLMAFLLYPLVSLITLEPFNCQPAGLGLLTADYREDCPKQNSFEIAYASFFLAIYPIGIPIANILMLRWLRVHEIARNKVVSNMIASTICNHNMPVTSQHDVAYANSYFLTSFNSAEYLREDVFVC
jgi:hypothetical protein